MYENYSSKVKGEVNKIKIQGRLESFDVGVGRLFDFFGLVCFFQDRVSLYSPG